MSSDLGASLNASSGTPVGTSASGSGPGTTAGFTLAAQACVIECVTLASASVGVTIGTQVQQTASVTPTVTYGDLVWISTNGKYSAGDPQAFIQGSSGSTTNPLGSLGSLGLNNGQQFSYNILPEVQLNLPVTSQAELDLPASITASYDILGVGGSKSFPLGNLYSLNTGSQTYGVTTTFHNDGLLQHSASL